MMNRNSLKDGDMEVFLRSILDLGDRARESTLEEVYQMTLDLVEELTGSVTGYFLIVNEDQETIRLVTWSSRTKEFCTVPELSHRYSIHEAGIWVDCFHQRKAVIHNDYRNEPHRKGLPEGHYPLVRDLSVPIIKDGKVRAIFGVGNKPEPYGSDDADVVSFVAEHIWSIISMKQAQEETARKLAINQAMTTISGSLISKDLTVDTMAVIILDRALTITGASKGYVTELEADSGHNRIIQSTDMIQHPNSAGDQGGFRFRPGLEGRFEALCGHALNTRSPHYTNSPADHPASSGIPEGHDPVENFLSVPVIQGGNLLGQIALANKDGGFNDDDLGIIVNFAHLFSLAITRTRNEEQLRKTIGEKDLLIKEVHHRVKNNMQVISSLLSLQSSKITDEEILGPFNDAYNRIRSISLVHESLYRSDDLTNIDIGEYLETFIDGLATSYRLSHQMVKVKVTSIKGTLDMDRMLPFSLFVNEVVSNVFKHAFAGKVEGSLSVDFEHGDDTHYLLSISDDGVGLPPGYDPSSSDTLGVQLISSLADQLHGKVHTEDNSPGARVVLRFRK